VDLSPGDEPVTFAAGAGSLGTAGEVLEPPPNRSEFFVRIDGRGRNIQLDGSPSGNAVITVKSGVTLYLRNITLTGIDANNFPIIMVDAGGTLAIEDAAVVRGNTNPTVTYVYDSNAAVSAGGIGVYGTLRMEGGEISGNTSLRSGGVYVHYGTLRMESGKISGNTGYNTGGVTINTGTFTMTGGEISGNTGDAVNNGGNFTMEGGEISRNTNDGFGGSVRNRSMGTFTMKGGKISGNTANFGGGVYNVGTFIMEGGEISGNTANGNIGSGGGVYLIEGTFTMKGGEISGNTATNNGGGVYIEDLYNAIFIKTGGIIYGDTDTDHIPGSTENTAKLGGHVVYVKSSSKKRNTDAGPEVKLYAENYSGSAWTFEDTSPDSAVGDTTANWE
jgi:hypothetical protein